MKNQKKYSEEEKKKYLEWFHRIDKRHRPKKAPTSQGKKVAFTECHCHYCSHTAMFRVDYVPNQCPKCGSTGWLAKNPIKWKKKEHECCEECSYYDKIIEKRYFQ